MQRCFGIFLIFGVLSFFTYATSAQTIKQMDKPSDILQKQSHTFFQQHKIKKSALKNARWFAIDLDKKEKFALFSHSKGYVVFGKLSNTSKESCKIVLRSDKNIDVLKGGELEIFYLHKDRPKEGFAITNGNNLTLCVAAFKSDFTRLMTQVTLQASEFSTTGWTTMNVGYDARSGYLSLFEMSESPGEETENGRTTESSVSNSMTWVPQKRRFVRDAEQ
jgi:hypothetical protein